MILILILLELTCSMQFLVGMYDNTECTGDAYIYMMYNLGSLFVAYGEDVTYDDTSMCYSCDECPSSARLSCGDSNEMLYELWSTSPDCPVSPAPYAIPVTSYTEECTSDPTYGMSVSFVCGDVSVGEDYAHVVTYLGSECTGAYQDISLDFFYKLNQCIEMYGYSLMYTSTGEDLIWNIYMSTDCTGTGFAIDFGTVGDCMENDYVRRFGAASQFVGFSEDDLSSTTYTSSGTNDDDDDGAIGSMISYLLF